MSYLPNNKEFRDPIVFDKRDYAVPRTDVNLKIINNRIVLNEQPDYIHHIKIDGYYEVFDTNSPLEDNQFFCDYQLKYIYFNQSQNGFTLPQIEYWGWGNFLIPADTVYVHSPNPYAVENLQEFIDLSTLKIGEINTAIGDSRKATQEAIEATENAIIATNETIIATTNAISATEAAEAATENAIEATEICNQTIADAQAELILLEQDRLRTRYEFKEPKQTLGEVYEAYPNPEVGWRVQTLIDGNVYRWDGIKWQLIENIQGAVIKATEDIDGLLSKEDFVKLQNIEENAQVNFIGEDAKKVLPGYVNTRTMVFVLSDEISISSASPIIKFPYAGEIVSVNAICRTAGVGTTEISVDMISESDFVSNNSWSSILETNLYFNANERIDDGAATISTSAVPINSYFKVSLISIGTGITDVTVQVNIKI